MLIGQTPLIRLGTLTPPDGASVFVKWEGANPTGSLKDRMALSMVEGAERRGDLQPGGRVVDYTGGSTGSSLAMVCAAKGYNSHFVSSDAFAEEKLQTMRAFGATVELIPSIDRKITPELIRAALDRVGELAAQSGTFWTDQFNNPDNRSGYHEMAEEILGALDERVDAFIQGVGTGGTFSGVSGILKKRVSKVECIAVEPENSRALSSSGPFGGHRLEGMGAGFKPSLFRQELADDIVAVSDELAMDTARQLARAEGVFGGISSGANVSVALERARQMRPDQNVVTIICDSGLKYLQGDLFSGIA